MILDGLLTFTGTSNGATGGIQSGAQTDSLAQTTGTYNASNILDLGLSGLPTSAGGGGARDIGVGDDPQLKLSAIITQTVTSGGAATLQVQLQGAPDNGSGAPGSYTTMWTSPTFALAALIQGAQLANVGMPRDLWEQVNPRFLQLQFIIGGATMTAGLIEANIVIDRFDQIIGTAGNVSGYPAGINVAN